MQSRKTQVEHATFGKESKREGEAMGALNPKHYKIVGYEPLIRGYLKQ